MKRILALLFFTGCLAMLNPARILCQQGTLQQLKAKLAQFKQQPNYLQDTAYANRVNELAFIYADSYPDSALSMLSGQVEVCRAMGYKVGVANIYKIVGNAWQTKGNYEKALEYYQLAYELAVKINYNKAIPGILNNIGLVHLNQGNYPEALKQFYQTLKAAESVGDQFLEGSALNNIAIVHFYQGKLAEAAAVYRQTLQIAASMSDTIGIILAYNNMGEVNLEQRKPATALHHLTIAQRLATLKKSPEMLVVTANTLANTFYQLDSVDKALYQFENALQIARQQDYGTAACKALIGLAKVYNKKGLLKEGLANGLEALEKSTAMGQVQLIRDANEIVAILYGTMGEGKKAVGYYQAYKLYSDSLHNIASERASASYQSRYEISKKELAFEKRALQQRWILFSALAALLALGIILWIINRNKKRLNQAYHHLQENNKAIEAQKLQAEDMLHKLKATQSQLIQSEKMASLGELTAGIAHEIQNPLNFVNNFSEVSKELLDEMKEALAKGDTGEAAEIANDVIQNLEKINIHGKRADAIVKGMLQHSRSSSGLKEPTNINELADEYVRLAYHGLRAKDKSFNATLHTDYDQSIGNINIISQDIGRVILNLITNAFYVVTDRKKQQSEGYEPTVSVTTKKEAGNILVSIKDNGLGIPPQIIDKIFQPFFTTKPTGQGTGLGLSLSYDIIKAHSGELKVETKEGEGSEFTIQLPVV